LGFLNINIIKPLYRYFKQMIKILDLVHPLNYLYTDKKGYSYGKGKEY